MRSVRLHGAGDLRWRDEPAPLVGESETLVRVTDVGVCGSDLHWFAEGGIGDARLTRPVVPGHEIAGVVEEGPLAGTPVAVDPAIPCGACPSCLRGNRNLCPQVGFAGHGTIDGGLREIMAWPTHLLHPLPPALATTDGAVLEPLGVAIHALDLGHLRPACTIAVVGCGPIGLLLLQAALASGATAALAVDPLAHRREERSVAGRPWRSLLRRWPPGRGARRSTSRSRWPATTPPSSRQWPWCGRVGVSCSSASPATTAPPSRHRWRAGRV